MIWKQSWKDNHVVSEEVDSFGKLNEPIERNKIKLVLSPFWVKTGPCPLEYDKKDFIHAIGSSFGGGG